MTEFLEVLQPAVSVVGNALTPIPLPARVKVSPDRLLGLDAVGARLWELLELDPDLERACSRILAEHDVEDDRLRSDLLSLIDRLAMVGLYSPP